MNGLEIFGGVGSAVAVIEAIWLVKSHITSAKQAKQEKIDMEGELKELKSLMQHIRNTLDQQPSLTSKPTLLNLLSRIDEGLKRVDKKRKGTWRVFWHLVKDDIRSIWANLERMRGFLELGLISQIGEHVSEHQQENAACYTMMMDDLKRDLNAIRIGVFRGNTRIEKRLDDTQKREIQRWLSPHSVYAELDDLRKKRAMNSGNWLLNSQVMKELLERDSDRKLVIVTGPAGCGKTMLSSTVADFLEAKGENYLPTFIKHASHMDLHAVLRTFLSAALGSFAALPDCLVEHYSKQTITEDDLSRILQNIIEAQNQPVCIVVDGIDELSSSGAELLDKLGSFFNSKLFVTSRLSAIPNRFQSSVLDLEASNESDLKEYIKEAVTGVCSQVRNGDTLTEMIIRKVIDASSGLFILASMHITLLGKARNKHDLSDIANRLPRTPDAYYESTLKRICSKDPKDSDSAIASLYWVSQAKRPLHIDELPIAAASALYSLTDSEVEDFVQPATRLLELCEGLIWEKDGFVLFSHLTVQEFFMKQGDIWFVLTRSCSGNSQVPCLGIACLGFLNARHSQRHLNEWNTLDHLECHRSFFVYSSQFWGWHISRIPTNQSLAAVSHFENNAAVFPIASQWYLANSRMWYYITTVYHMLARFNLVAYFPENVGVANLDVLDSNGRSPLWIACEHGHIEITRLLLGISDVKVDSRDYFGESSLWIACENGHLEIARLLLEKAEVEADARSKYGKSPLWIACRNGHTEISRLLLEIPMVEADSRDGSGRSPLWIACNNGHSEIARLLLEKPSVQADSRDNDGRSPLWAACRSGHIDITRLLLTKPDVAVDYRDKAGIAPLKIACQSGHSDIAALLREKLQSRLVL